MFYKGYKAGSSSTSPVQTLLATMAYTNTTAKALFTIPAGAYIVGWLVNISTAFNDSGTDLLDIGISGTQQKFAAALVVSAAAQLATGFVVGQIGVVQATAQAVTGLYTGQNSDANAGAAQIICNIIIP